MSFFSSINTKFHARANKYTAAAPVFSNKYAAEEADSSVSSCYSDSNQLQATVNDSHCHQEPIIFEPLNPQTSKYRLSDTIAPSKTMHLSATCPNCSSDVPLESPISSGSHEYGFRDSVSNMATSPEHCIYTKTGNPKRISSNIEFGQESDQFLAHKQFRTVNCLDDLETASFRTSSSDWSVALTEDNSPESVGSSPTLSDPCMPGVKDTDSCIFTTQELTEYDLDTLRRQVVPTLRVNRYSTTMQTLPRLKSMEGYTSTNGSICLNSVPTPKQMNLASPTPVACADDHTTTSPFVRTRFVGEVAAQLTKKPHLKQSWNYIIPELRQYGLVDRRAAAYRVLSTAVSPRMDQQTAEIQGSTA